MEGVIAPDDQSGASAVLRAPYRRRPFSVSHERDPSSAVDAKIRRQCDLRCVDEDLMVVFTSRQETLQLAFRRSSGLFAIAVLKRSPRWTRVCTQATVTAMMAKEGAGGLTSSADLRQHEQQSREAQQHPGRRSHGEAKDTRWATPR